MIKKEKIILNLSSLDYGGAGKFAVDFHALLNENGYQSYLIVKDSSTKGKGIIPFVDSKFNNIIGKICRRLRKERWIASIFKYDYYFYNKYERYSTVSAKKIINLLPKNPDVIFIHWVTDFINAKLINELKQRTNAKIYWLLIDNAPLTGGCHYPWNCKGFMKGCMSCPAIVSEKYKWISKANLAFKKKYIPNDTTVIAFSESDFKRAHASSLFNDKRIIKLIGFVDEELFVPGNKSEARKYFGLPEGKKIIFFGASSLKERRKGMHLLVDAISSLENQDIHLLIAGKLNETITNLPAKHVGYLSNSDLIKAYQAADVFVCPSIEDSGPMMINQSLMCGTPVVAFNIGVAQDLVISGKTGYNVSNTNAESLAEGIETIVFLTPEIYSILSNNCRIFAQRVASKMVYSSKIDSLINELTQHE